MLNNIEYISAWSYYWHQLQYGFALSM